MTVILWLRCTFSISSSFSLYLALCKWFPEFWPVCPVSQIIFSHCLQAYKMVNFPNSFHSKCHYTSSFSIFPVSSRLPGCSLKGLAPSWKELSLDWSVTQQMLYSLSGPQQPTVWEPLPLASADVIQIGALWNMNFSFLQHNWALGITAIWTGHNNIIAEFYVLFQGF